MRIMLRFFYLRKETEMDSGFLKNTFSKVITDYDLARPIYPEAVYQQIMQFSEIGENANILEVGAGTGKATDLFVNRNLYSQSNKRINHFYLDLLEVSDEQVAFLENKYHNYPQINVKRNYFEEYIADKQYDLIYSATAFHWVKSDIGYPKAWEMLKPGGTLAVFWQMSSVTYYNDEIFKGLNAIKQKYLPNESLGFDAQGINQVKEKRISQIQSGGYFEMPKIYEFRWTDTYDADKYTKLVNTYSSTQTLQEDVKNAYLEEIKRYINHNGGIVILPQLVMLYLVKKTH